MDKAKVKVKLHSLVRLFATPWTVAPQAPPSMGFSRQEYWSGVPLPSPGKMSISNTEKCLVVFSNKLQNHALKYDRTQPVADYLNI